MDASQSTRNYSNLIPVFLAPLVAGIYYIFSVSAFSLSIQSALVNATDINPKDAYSPQWGTHWIYRIFAEGISIFFATFIAAGMSRSRTILSATVAGLTISAGYAAVSAILIWDYLHSKSEGFVFNEPWYQYATFLEISLGESTWSLRDRAREIALKCDDGYRI